MDETQAAVIVEYGAKFNCTSNIREERRRMRHSPLYTNRNGVEGEEIDADGNSHIRVRML